MSATWSLGTRSPPPQLQTGWDDSPSVTEPGTRWDSRVPNHFPLNSKVTKEREGLHRLSSSAHNWAVALIIHLSGLRYKIFYIFQTILFRSSKESSARISFLIFTEQRLYIQVEWGKKENRRMSG